MATVVAPTLGTVVVLLAVTISLSAKAQAASELPPSPFNAQAMAGRVPLPDRGYGQELDLDVVSTNQTEMLLQTEIKELKTQLAELEATIYTQNPQLKLFAQYAELAHDWVTRNHAAELGASMRYFNSKDTSNAQPKPGTERQLVDLIDLTLYKELAGNTNFAPLLQATFEAAASKLPTLFGTAYTRTDRLTGFRPATRPAVVTNFQAYVEELDKRYDGMKAKLEAIQREEAVSAEVVAGLRWGELYRLLDGAAQMYVEFQTPEPLTKLRQQLRSKRIDLSNLRAASRPKAQ